MTVTTCRPPRRPARSPTQLRARRPRRADRDAQDAAAEVLLRRARQRAVRRDHPAAGVLPDPRRARDPRRPARARSPRCTGADTLVELGSGTSEKTRLLLDGAARGRARCAASCPFDVDPAVLARRGERRRRGVSRASPSSRSSATSSSTSAGCPTAPAGGWSPSSARRSATSSRRPRGTFLRRVRATLDRATRSCSAPTWSRTPTGSSRAYDDAAGVTAAFNRNVLGRAQPRARRRLRPGRVRARRAVGRRAASGSRCGCGRRATSWCTSAELDLDGHVRRR